MGLDRITYGQLDDLLVRLGFSRQRIDPKWLRYEHLGSDTVIVLVAKPSAELVRITDAVSAARHLVEKGFVTEDVLEAMLSRSAAGQEAASAKKG